jgi:hypothetical protein
MKAQADSSSRGQKDFICREEKKKERLHGGECRGTWKLVVPWSGRRLGFYSLFVYCSRAEMSLRCRKRFPGKERCLLDHLSPFGTSSRSL